MSSIDNDFNELRDKIAHGRELNARSFEPVYYLVFPSSEILYVKQKQKNWAAKFRRDGYEVKTYSIAKTIEKILSDYPYLDLMVQQESQPGSTLEQYREAIREVIEEKISNGMKESLENLAESKNGLMLVTDLEALHPFLRIGTIEAKLQNQFSAPTVFLYPGKRSGQTALKFLGFYPEDGNYRSIHVGS